MSGIQIRFLLDEHIAHVIRDGQHLNRRLKSALLGVKMRLRMVQKTMRFEFLEREGFILVRKTDVQWPGHLVAHLQKGGHVPGILLLRRGYDYGEIILTLQLIWGASAPEDFQDQITRIPYR